MQGGWGGWVRGGGGFGSAVAGFGGAVTGLEGAVPGFGGAVTGLEGSVQGLKGAVTGFGGAVAGFGSAVPGLGGAVAGLGVAAAGFGSAVAGFGITRAASMPPAAASSAHGVWSTSKTTAPSKPSPRSRNPNPAIRLSLFLPAPRRGLRNVARVPRCCTRGYDPITPPGLMFRASPWLDRRVRPHPISPSTQCSPPVSSAGDRTPCCAPSQARRFLSGVSPDVIIPSQ